MYVDVQVMSDTRLPNQGLDRIIVIRVALGATSHYLFHVLKLKSEFGVFIEKLHVKCQ